MIVRWSIALDGESFPTKEERFTVAELHPLRTILVVVAAMAVPVYRVTSE